MNYKQIIKNPEGSVFDGCDFVVCLPEERKEKKVEILQLTDMQVIDASQRRTPDRLRPDELGAWKSENFDLQCGNHIKSLITQTKPDLIIITGDIVYGSFDDSGSTLKYICNLMDSFEIPWAPVFGNHDNESEMGVGWQCEQFEKSPYCLFKRGNVSGNGNYTVGIAAGEKLLRVIHMTDSNGCSAGTDTSIINEAGIYPDQLEQIKNKTALIKKMQGNAIPAFLAFHIPTKEFKEAEFAKGYKKDEADRYILGVDASPKDNDFGFSLEGYRTIDAGDDFLEFLKSVNADGIFAGHVHNNCFCISYKDILWTFGLKTGLYDYHIPYQTGGTLITLEGSHFNVKHLPSLVPARFLPGKAPMFKDFFAPDEL